jgi:hypothetical protein
MAQAQVKAMEVEQGEAVNLSGIFQQRAAIRVKLANGVEAIRAATLASGDAAQAVEETANAPIAMAAQAIAAGLIGKDEVSEMLCKAFGAKPTKEGKPGKTPEGYGLTVRKRVVTISDAIRIANGEVTEVDFPKWAQGKDVSFIAETVESLLSGDKASGTVYRDLTEKERAPQPPLAFNPEKLAKLAEELAKPESVERVKQSPALMAAYEAIALAIAGFDAPIDF